MSLVCKGKIKDKDNKEPLYNVLHQKIDKEIILEITTWKE